MLLITHIYLIGFLLKELKHLLNGGYTSVWMLSSIGIGKSMLCKEVDTLNKDPQTTKLALDGYLSSKFEQLELQRLVLAERDAKQQVCD